jgi:hypothetical protein
MARISHRTPEYNMAAGHLHLQAVFATTQSYTEHVNTPSFFQVDAPADRITRYYKETHTAVESAMRIFCRHRTWYKREMVRASLHPTIKKLLNNPEHAQYLTDWREMVLEYPHTADTDDTKIAFTENEAKGIADRQTTTTLGKYIKRHAPEMPDHVLRDIVMLSVAEVVLVHDLPSMIDAVQSGPRSCMQGGFNVHPYSVYDPQYGWHMAVRREGGDIVGRCLCLTHGGEKMFVRSYRRHDNGYSQSDEGLNAWLEERGYRHRGDWPQGVSLAKIWDNGELVLPYIDGNSNTCAEHTAYLTLDDNGEYEGSQQNGYAASINRCSCDDCGDSFDDGDGTYTGRHEDNHVCDDCSRSYTYVYGRYGHQYYISDDDVVHVDGEAYDQDYLRDNNIVFCEHDGDYHSLDDCYELDGSGDYVHRDDCYDDTIVCLDADDCVFAYKSDCWQCAGTELWYSSDTGSGYYAQSWTGADGRLYHEDELPEADTDEQDAHNKAMMILALRDTLTFDAVLYAENQGVPLHCHHVTQFIEHINY